MLQLPPWELIFQILLRPDKCDMIVYAIHSLWQQFVEEVLALALLLEVV